jgi:hypothetical protein
MLNDVCYMNETDCHYEDSGDSDASGWKEFASPMEESAELGVCKRNTVRRDGVINEVDTKRDCMRACDSCIATVRCHRRD